MGEDVGVSRRLRSSRLVKDSVFDRLAGLYPAWRMASALPAETLRDE